MSQDITLHHSHFVTSDVEGFCTFFTEHFGAEIVFDRAIDGDRNVFLKVGSGRIHLFESRNAPPRERNAFHHLGFLVADLDAVVARLLSEGVEVGSVTKVPGGGFAMATGPDGLLMELFEVTSEISRPFFLD
ncbi:MAG: hypothetical protein GYB53_07385 [Rhodobacteraceae bacterium]|nr:hypothetical protein [Paracoccaceae bacterium]MBR9823609.1 hypothetical protein [Paracoccaceae bacterium]